MTEAIEVPRKVLFHVYLNTKLDAIDDFDLSEDIIQIFEIQDIIENIKLSDLFSDILSVFSTINNIKSKIECNNINIKLASFDHTDIIIDDDDALHEEINAMIPDEDDNNDIYVKLRILFDKTVSTYLDTSVSTEDAKSITTVEDEEDMLAKAIRMSLEPDVFIQSIDTSCNKQISIDQYDSHLLQHQSQTTNPYPLNKYEEQKTNNYKYNTELVDQLFSMGMGTKQQIMTAMDVVNNRNDIYELLEYFKCMNDDNTQHHTDDIKQDFDEKYNVFNDDNKYPVLPLLIPDNCTYDVLTNKIRINGDKNRNILKLHEPAVEFIRNISCKIATISIVGRARTGKSLVAGELYAPKCIPCPFDLGHKMDACTYGIWVSAKPIKHPNEKDTVILIFDVEGTGFHQATKHNDMQLMVITLLISSYFIYNTKGTFTSAALDELEFVTELTDRIQVKPNDDDGDGLEYILPNFMWLLRDVHLNPTINDKIVSAKDYFTEKVLKYEKGKNKKVQKRQNIRSMFIQTFRTYDAFALPPPHSNTDTLQKLGVIQRDKLEPQFNKQLDVFYEKVINEAKCKVLFIENESDKKQNDEDNENEEEEEEEEMEINQFIHCRGSHIAGWIEQCIEYINDPDKIPQISSMTAAVMSSVFRESKERAIIEYKQLLVNGLNKLRNNNNEIPLNEKHIIDLHINIWNTILIQSGNSLQSFYNELDDEKKSIDINGMNQVETEQFKIYQELCHEVGHNNDVTKIGGSGVLKEILRNNHNLSIKSCQQYLNEYFIQNIKPMLDESEQFEASQVIEAWKDLYSNYYANCTGPAKTDCWKQFENNKKNESIEQFKKMKGYSDDLANTQQIVMQQMKNVQILQNQTENLKEQKLQQSQIHNEEIERINEKREEQQKEHDAKLKELAEKVKDAKIANWRDFALSAAQMGFQGYMAYKENTKIEELTKKISQMEKTTEILKMKQSSNNSSDISSDISSVIKAVSPIAVPLVKALVTSAECLIQ